MLGPRAPAPSLFVLIPGWGAPHLREKRAILGVNLKRIASHHWSSVHIRVCVYDASPEARLDPGDIHAAFIAAAEAAAAVPRPKVIVEVLYDAGAPGDFIRRFAAPDDPAVCDADYALLLLDDVELQPDTDFAEMLRYQRDFGPAIVSPTLTYDSLHVFPHMLQGAAAADAGSGLGVGVGAYAPRGPSASVTPVCEFFAYFMDTAVTLPRYHAFMDPENPWMWGADLLLHCRMGIKAILAGGVTMRHHFKGSGATPETFAARRAYLAKHGETEESVAQQAPFLYHIVYPAPAAEVRQKSL
jgi:hypothetical protein